MSDAPASSQPASPASGALATAARAPVALAPDDLFRQMAEALPHLVWSTTPDGYHDYFNERWYAYTGMPRPGEPGGEGDQPQGWNWKEYLHPDDVARTLGVWQECLRTGAPYEVEYRFRGRDSGEYRWFLARAVALRDVEGRIVRWLGTCTDVHEAKAHEAQLAEQAHALRLQNEQLQQQALELELQAQHVQEQAAELEAGHEALAATNVELEQALHALERTAAEHRVTAERATLLQATASVLAEATTAEAIAEAMLTLATDHLGARHATIALRLDAGAPDVAGHAAEATEATDADQAPPAATLRILTSRRLPGAVRDRYAHVPVDDALPMTAAVHRARPVYLGDAAAIGAEHPQVATLVRELGVAAVAALPLIAEAAHGPLGALVLDYGEPRRFDGDDRALLEAFAAQGAQALARALAAESLREQEARFRLVQELSPDGFILCRAVRDGAGRVVDFVYEYANAAAEQILGRRTESLLGQRMTVAYPTTRENGVLALYARVAESGEPYQGHFLYEGDGLGTHFRVAVVRVDDRVAITFLDETAQVRLREALEVERARLTRLFRQAPALIAVVRGPTHVFEMANDAYLQLIGRTRETIVGRPVHEVLPEVVEQGFIPLLDRVLATGEPYVGREVPVRLVRAPGAPAERCHVTFVYQPLEEADGTRSGIFVHGVDVTDQVAARETVEQARAESELARRRAEEANRVKSEFLAVMSHELRTPLNAIGGYAELIALEVHGPVTDGQRDALDRLQRAQRHLLRLITDVLNYARIEAGRVEYRLEVLAVADVVRDVAQLVEPLVSGKGLTLVVEPPSAALHVLADREKAAQVVLNLLTNAVKFTGAGGRVTLDWLATEWDGAEAVAVRVTDTGRGIPVEKLAAVFEPFVQVEGGRTRTNDGVGLGLAISRDLARGMGGELSATSAVGEGSRFCLVLPRARAVEQDRRTGDERREGDDRRELDDRRAHAAR